TESPPTTKEETPKPSLDVTPKKPSEAFKTIESIDTYFDEELVGSRDRNEGVRQNRGIIHYLPVLFGAILVFMISRSENLDISVLKLIWAAFAIGRLCEIMC